DPEPTSLEMLDRLVGFDTTSEKTNLPLIDFVHAYLGNLGIEPVLSWDQTGTKANLFATIGRSDRPGIILSAHTDVVPVSGQQWNSDPFVLTRRGDRLYGRGTTDMKGFLA